MKPIPFQWLKYASYAIFIQMVAFVAYLWYSVFVGDGEAPLALGISVVGVFTYPELKNAGWGVWGGRNLCPNLATFLVACFVALLSAVPFWIGLIDSNMPDYLFFLGWLLPGLLIIRAYSDMSKAYKNVP